MRGGRRRLLGVVTQTGIAPRGPGSPKQFITGHQRRRKQRWVVDGTTGCWLWTGRVGNGGYGDSWDRTKRGSRKAHRVIYEELVGPIPAGLELDHVRERGCVHRHCVNPAHLEPVTREVNIQRSPIAKLTAEHVAEIRRRFADRGSTTHRETATQLAAEYGVSWFTVSELVRGKTWKNVAPVPARP